MLDTPVGIAPFDTSRLATQGATAGRVARMADANRQAETSLASLERFLDEVRFDASDAASLGEVLSAMIARGFDRLPLPGEGATLMRWHALAAVAACDLGLVKLFEGHTDALAIVAELHSPVAPEGSRWGVWAAEPPDAKVLATSTGNDGRLRLDGVKAWCSGAEAVSHALVTAWLNDEPVLAAVDMQPPSISISCEHWHAVGMHATASGDVRFDGAGAMLVGGPHDYVKRPGFWQGGAGIAACWYGAAAGIARTLRDAVARRPDPWRLAHLGAVDAALSGAAAVLRETAACIDAHPHMNIQREALRARLVVEEAATVAMTHAGRALGAGPLCRDPRFARAMADLPVFLRQSHAERDLAALGETFIEDAGRAWTL